jgi:hypothetical protein
MTTDLRESLDDLLAEVPDHVSVSDPDTAWRAGARRRVRRRVTTAGAVVAVLALLSTAGLVGSRIAEVDPAGERGAGAGATSYPARIERPLLRTGTLPDDVGAIAGVVQRPDGWYAVGQRGQVWRILGGTDTGYLPSVSPDGSRLAYMYAKDHLRQLTLKDLRTGTDETPHLAVANPLARTALALRTQTFWSPDSSRLLVPTINSVGQGEPDAAVIPMHGSTRAVVVPHAGRLLAAGWYDDHTLVWVTWKRDPQGGVIVGSATALLTNLHGHVEQRIPLRMKGVWTDPPDSTSVSVSPDGTVLALGTDQGPDLSVWWFHLRGPLRGYVKSELPPSASTNPSGCPASWSDTIELPGAGYPDTVLTAAGGGPSIYSDPRLNVSCSVWASAALGGAPYQDLTARVFDDSGRIQMGTTSWLSWHWREVVIASGVGAVLFVAVRLVLLRRRRTRLTV